MIDRALGFGIDIESNVYLITHYDSISDPGI